MLRRPEAWPATAGAAVVPAAPAVLLAAGPKPAGVPVANVAGAEAEAPPLPAGSVAVAAVRAAVPTWDWRGVLPASDALVAMAATGS
ncbi:hypothetical protein GCM10027048_15570 [Hymenobacter coalescens]